MIRFEMSFVQSFNDGPSSLFHKSISLFVLYRAIYWKYQIVLFVGALHEFLPFEPILEERCRSKANVSSEPRA